MKKCNSFDGNPKINLYEFLYLFQVRPRMQMLGYQFVPPPEAASAQLLPPLTPHQSLGQVAKPQHPRLPGYSGYLGGLPGNLAGERKGINDSPGTITYRFLTAETNLKALYIFRCFLTQPQQLSYLK